MFHFEKILYFYVFFKYFTRMISSIKNYVLLEIDYTHGLSLQNDLKMNSLRLPFTNLIDRSKQTITKA